MNESPDLSIERTAGARRDRMRHGVWLFGLALAHSASAVAGLCLLARGPTPRSE